MKIYHQIRHDRLYGDMLHTHRCPKCKVAVVEAQHDDAVWLDARHRKNDQWGNRTALKHECATKQRKSKSSDLWD